MWKRTKRKAEYIVVCWERLPCGASACRSAWGLAMGDEAFMGDRALAYTRSLHPFPLLRKPLRPRLDGVLSTLAAVAAEASSMLLVAVRKGSIYDSYSVLFPWEISPRFCYAVITILQPFAAQRGAGRISPRCSRLSLPGIPPPTGIRASPRKFFLQEGPCRSIRKRFGACKVFSVLWVSSWAWAD